MTNATNLTTRLAVDLAASEYDAYDTTAIMAIGAVLVREDTQDDIIELGASALHSARNGAAALLDLAEEHADDHELVSPEYLSLLRRIYTHLNDRMS